MIVPQPKYKCGTNQRGWKRKRSIPFFVRGKYGVRLFDALERKIKGMHVQDAFPLEDRSAITIRIHVVTELDGPLVATH